MPAPPARHSRLCGRLFFERSAAIEGVELMGLSGDNASLNCQKCAVHRYVAQTQCYVCILPSGDKLSVLPANLRGLQRMQRTHALPGRV